MKAKHPRLGRLILAVTDEPQSTKAWAQGADGERRIGARLDALAERGAVVLHDRQIPRGRANIDHVVVARSGVWLVDTKNYRGEVSKRDVGGLFRRDERLFVGRRDCSSLIAGTDKQVAAVVDALDAHTSTVPIHPVLCFVAAEWRLFARPLVIRGVMITWVKPLISAIEKPTSSDVDVHRVADRLASVLRPAR